MMTHQWVLVNHSTLVPVRGKAVGGSLAMHVQGTQKPHTSTWHTELYRGVDSRCHNSMVAEPVFRTTRMHELDQMLDVRQEDSSDASSVK